MITLNYRDSRPIYEQIREGFKRLIVTGALTAEERLPSVRTLATQLSINPNTIQRAYAELEREGYCYSVPGKGSFVSGDADAGEKRRRDLRERFCALAAELKFLGTPEETLIALVRQAGAATAAAGNPDAATSAAATAAASGNPGAATASTGNPDAASGNPDAAASTAKPDATSEKTKEGIS